MSRSACLLLVMTVLAAAGCGDDAIVTTPTPPTVNTVTETFSGTVNTNGAATYAFTVQSGGTVTATLTTIAPDAAVVLGLSLGTWNGLACQIVLANDQAVQGTPVTAVAQSAGNLCVRVYDVGKVTQPTSYDIQVVHP